MTDLIPVDTTGDRTRLACPQCRSTRVHLVDRRCYSSPGPDGRSCDRHTVLRFRCADSHDFAISFIGDGDTIAVECVIEDIRAIIRLDGRK